MCQTYDYKVMPVSQNIYALFNSGFWMAYGWMSNLMELFIPNLLMEFICVGAIIFYVVYRRKYMEKYGDKPESQYAELAEVSPGERKLI